MAQPDRASSSSGATYPPHMPNGPEYLAEPGTPPCAVTPTSSHLQPTTSGRRRNGWLLSGGSAALSFLVVAVLLRSSGIALALLALIFVHEMGHVVVLKLLRIQVSAPIFIPLIGAFVVSGQIRRARDAALVALAGPFAGGLGALACLLVARRLGVVACLAPTLGDVQAANTCFTYTVGPGYGWLVLAYVGFIFNLLNLLPLFPLDGGRVAATISRWYWPFGILISAGLLLLQPNPVTGILVLVAIALSLWAFWQPEPLAAPPASPATKGSIAAVYIGLALLLAVGMLMTKDALALTHVAPFLVRP